MIELVFALALCASGPQMPADAIVQEALDGNLPQDPSALRLIFGHGKQEPPTVPSVDGTTSYRVVVDPLFDPFCFRSTVDSVLADSRSWPDMRPAERGEIPQIWIRLTKPADACGTAATFSYHCAWGTGNGQGQVTINYQRWDNPVDDAVDTYSRQAFVINHEVGHLLGFDHEQCSVMGGPGYGEWADCPIIVWPDAAERELSRQYRQPPVLEVSSP